MADGTPGSKRGYGIAVRLSLFYVAFFGMIGVYMPFWPVWLVSRGLEPTEIGLLLGIAAGVRLFAAPLIAGVGDRSGRRRRLIAALAIGALAAFALYAWTLGFWPILAVTVLFTVVWSPLMPLGETLVNLAVRRHGLQYGPIRLWGSLGFIVAAVIGGRALVGRPDDIIFWLLLGLVAATAAACGLLPEAPPDDDGGRRPPLRSVLANPGFLLFLAAAGLIQSSHGVYYGFGTLYWKTLGYSEAAIGALWAEGVIAEVVLFAFSGRITKRFSPSALILIGALAAVARWTVTGLTGALPAVALMQLLHALTFGATHLGAITFIMQRVPPALSATAMSLYGSVLAGLAMGASILLSGPLYAAFGGGAYLAMTGIGVAGAGLALLLARRTGEER
ncbi:3-phenylpropionate MFS transporter [Shumkonia mesophila]|uniref:3-phenylpropionate MFS transporter n=1 Tax=Shumkonia mesophila TaxID=2838854 RepID=UPI002934DE2C|nr:3-phenylpropionate MFS transporter [Shumkonia mesophila]